MKQKLLKTLRLLFVAVGLSVGMSAWATVTPFSESYSSTSSTTGWVSANAANGRFVPTLLNEGDNYFMSVNQSTAKDGDGGRYNNGTTVTGSIINGKASSGDNFTLT